MYLRRKTSSEPVPKTSYQCALSCICRCRGIITPKNTSKYKNREIVENFHSFLIYFEQQFYLNFVTNKDSFLFLSWHFWANFNFFFSFFTLTSTNLTPTQNDTPTDKRGGEIISVKILAFSFWLYQITVYFTRFIFSKCFQFYRET